MSPIARPLAVTFDCHDPVMLASFWQRLVGGEVERATADADWVALSDVPVFGHLGFQKVPEGKAVKNRVHLDLDVDDTASERRATRKRHIHVSSERGEM